MTLLLTETLENVKVPDRAYLLFIQFCFVGVYFRQTFHYVYHIGY